jgi:DNA-binding response OmpR family regulator
MADFQKSDTAARTAVLVVEDDPVIRKLIKIQLSGFQLDVFEAATAHAALDACRAQTPALVFLDIGLPDGSGVDVCSEIKRLYPNTVVCMISGVVGREGREKSFGAGCSAYLLKPFGSSEFNTLVTKLLAGITGTTH